MVSLFRHSDILTIPHFVQNLLQPIFAFSGILLRQNLKDLDLDLQAHIAATRKEFTPVLINCLQQSPASTASELQAQTRIARADLNSQLTTLEEKGFISGHYEGEQRRFVLTALGRILYREMCLTPSNRWVDQWSTKRLKVCFGVVHKLQTSENPVYLPMISIVNFIASLSEKQITKLLPQVTENAPSLAGSKYELLTRGGNSEDILILSTSESTTFFDVDYSINRYQYRRSLNERKRS